MNLPINSSGAVVLAMLACTAIAQTPTAPASGPSTGIAAKAVTMPPVRYACIPFSLPEDEDAAKAVIDAARQKWLDATRAAGIKESSNIFFHAAMPQAAAPTATSIPTQACAIVDSQANPSGMTVLDVPARSGVAGFCEKQLDVQNCLANVAKQLGFTDAKPWPWLPMYARWEQEAQAPQSANDVVTYLATKKIELKAATSGSGATVEQSSQGLKPLVPCTGCPATPQVDTLTPAGAGVGWFLQGVVPPSPSQDRDMPNH